MISVIIPTHNRQELVGQAIRSVLAQSYRDFEIIVIDDGSTDDTRAVIQAVDDPRLRYAYQQNAGLSAARNAGIRLSQGEYVAFLDDDDLWLPHKLEAQVRVVQKRPEVALVAGGLSYTNEDGACISDNKPWLYTPRLDLPAWLRSCPVVPSTVMVSRGWLSAVGGFDEGLRFAEDWDLWLRLAYNGCQMAWVEDILCLYRVSDQGLMRRSHDRAGGYIAIFDKFFATPGLPGALAAQKAEVCARIHLLGAAWAYEVSALELAKQHVELAVGLAPNLLARGGEVLVSTVMGMCANPAIAKPITYARRVLDNMPDTVHVAAKQKRLAVAHAAAAQLFRMNVRHDRRVIGQCLWLLMLNQPTRLCDRGALSVALGAALGERAESALRKLLRKPGPALGGNRK